MKDTKTCLHITYKADTYTVDRPLHHELILEAYSQSFKYRNLTAKYLADQERRLRDVFQGLQISDEQYPTIKRPVDTFDILNPLIASKIIAACYRDLPSEARTIACLKAIERYGQFVQANSTIYLSGQKTLCLTSIYGFLQSPVNRYTIPKKSHERKTHGAYLTKSEYRLFLNYTWQKITPDLKGWALLRVSQLYVMCVIAGELGLRLNEVLGLEPKHLNLVDGRCMVVRGKGHCGSGYRKREVPLSVLTKVTIQSFLKRFPREADEPLFQSQTKQRLGVNTAGRWMKQLQMEIEKTDLKIYFDYRFGWHALRRTFATDYVEKGGYIRDLMQITGWSFMSTASHYIGCTKEVTLSKTMPLYQLGAADGG